MEKNNALTKTLAITGTVLAWGPILAPIILTIIALIATGAFHFDFLMPAELFPFALLGGGLLIWAAFRSGSHLKLIGWGLAITTTMLASAQGLAVITGLASGENAPEGWRLIIVLVALVCFIGAMIAMAVGGVLLIRDLFKAEE